MKITTTIAYNPDGTVRGACTERATATGTTADAVTAADLGAWLGSAATLEELAVKAARIAELESEVAALEAELNAIAEA